jgi:hypothetical protein
MFDDHWRICCRSQDSAGKRTVKTPYFEDQENTRKLYFARRLKKPEGGGERGHRMASPPGGAA